MSNPLPAHVQQDFLDPRHESWFDVQDLTNLITYRDERDQPVLMGGSADIYQAELRGQPVAVKVMRITVTNENEKKELERKIRREVRIWSNIHHKNILPFLGICFFRGRDGSSNGEFPWFSLVSPWMKNGTAGRYIREVKGACVITVLHEFLSGLSFLHQNSVIHGDLKPSNIFISDDGTAMLADFGLSRSTWGGSFVATPGLTTTSTGIKGSLRWTAPELLEKPKATQASDMWAVGCILLELVGLMPPYGDYRTESNIIYAISSHKLPHEAPDLSAANDRLSYHNTMRSYSVHLGPGVFDRYPGLWDLCLRCWSIDPAARPPCYNVYQFLMMIDQPGVFRRRVPSQSFNGANNVIVDAFPLSGDNPPSNSPGSQGEQSVEAPSSLHFVTPYFQSPLSSQAKPHTAFKVIAPWEHASIVTARAQFDHTENELGQNHRETIAALGSLANVYALLQRYEEAEKCMAKTFARACEVLTEGDPLRLKVRHDMVVILRGICGGRSPDRYAEAEASIAEVIRDRMRYLGEDHEDTLLSLQLQALLISGQGRWQEAEHLFVTLLERSKRVLGEDSVVQLQTQQALVEVLRAQKRSQEAGPLILDILGRRSRLLGVDHPETLLALRSLADNLVSKGFEAEARALYSASNSRELDREVKRLQNESMDRSATN